MQPPIRENRNAPSRAKANRARPNALEDIARQRAPAAKHGPAGSKTARRRGSAASLINTSKQKMPPSNDKSHERHEKIETYKKQRVASQPRHRHRSAREAEPDSEIDHVYPQERRPPNHERLPYKEVRVLGRDGDEEEADADEREDERNDRGVRPRLSRTTTDHHNHRPNQHRHERERSREHRSSHSRRSDERREDSEGQVRREEREAARTERHRQRDERERQARREERRAAEAEKHAGESRPSSRTKHEHQPEPVSWVQPIKIFLKRSMSLLAPSVPHKPQPRCSNSDDELSRRRRRLSGEVECDEDWPPAEKYKHERRKYTKEEAPAKVKTVERVTCVVCMDDEIKSSKARKLECGHCMCHSCLRRSFELSIKDPQQMPPKCCAPGTIPRRLVNTLFTDEVWIKKWKRKYREYTTKDRIYCPTKKCGKWIRPDNIKIVDGKRKGTCRKCKTRVCGTCNAKWHGARECPKDEQTNALLETAREQGWKQCYSCRTLVELKEGCNHMTCRCTAEFCMLCGAKWRTCECPWFNYETVQADRLAHMRVPADRPAPPPLFPRPAPRANPNNPWAALFPPVPPRPAQAPVPANVIAPPNDVFAYFGQMMNQQQNFLANAEQQAQLRQRERARHLQLLRQQEQLEERQRQLRADEELARGLANLNTTENEAPPRRRRRQASIASSETPESVLAGFAGPGRRGGSGRVPGWMANVPLEAPRMVPVR